MKNLVITPSDLLQVEQNILEENSDYINSILENKFFEYDTEPGQISLYDTDNTKVLQDNTSIEQINKLLKNKNLESLKINSLYPELYLPNDVKSVDFLTLHGNTLNTYAADSKHKLYTLANQIKNILPYASFIETIEERTILESSIYELYQKMLEYKIDFISDDLIDFIIKKDIKQLELGWFPLSDNDYKKLAALDLDAFSLLYSFKRQLKILPKTISLLSILGNSITSLKDIAFEKLKLSELDLSGNSIKDKIELNQFYNKLEFLTLTNNLLAEVDFLKTSNNLEYLVLSRNIITNDGLIIPEPCNHITFLDLSYNKLKVNLDFLFKLDSYFPNLEYLDLSGNEFMDSFGQEVLASNVDQNQIEYIKSYLDVIEYFQDRSFIDVKESINKYDNKYYSKLLWKFKNSSTELLIKEIQYHLQTYLKFLKDDEYIFFAEGVYFNLKNKNISVLLRSSNDTISLVIFSSKESVSKDYFYKYLELIHDSIFYVTHQNILPTIETSNNLLDLHDFFRKVYRIDAKLKQKKSAAYLVELDSKTNKYTLLVNETQDYHDTRVDIDKVMFVIVSSKSVIVYYLTKDNTISNYVLDKNDKRVNSLIIRTADDKEKYKRTLLNPYLSNKPFQDIDAYVDGEIKKKFNLIINPFYIYQKQEELGVLYLNTDSYKIDPNNRNTEHSSVVNISNNELLFVSKQ